MNSFKTAKIKGMRIMPMTFYSSEFQAKMSRTEKVFFQLGKKIFLFKMFFFICIFYYLFILGSWRQQVQEQNPGFPLPIDTFYLLLGNLKVFLDLGVPASRAPALLLAPPRMTKPALPLKGSPNSIRSDKIGLPS